jgi:hypothetical protein
VRKKTFTITAGPLGRQLLAEAIRSFAHAAYPPGGSDCAQVARETLFTTAETIEYSDAVASASTRHRVLLRQAAEWYCDNIEDVAPERRAALNEALQALLRGQVVDDSLFEQPGAH